MHHHWHRHCVLIALLLGLSGSGYAADEALLQVLLNNQLITQEQYEALVQAQAAQPKAAAGQPVAGMRLPTQEEGLLDVLLANELISQEQYAALQVKNAEDKAKKSETKEAKVTLADGFKVKSTDGDFQAQVSMYVQSDSAWYSDDVTDFSDGTELRRARLSLSGTVYRDWDYKMEADFAGTTQGGTTNNVTVTDAFVRYNGFKPFAFTAGNFKIPFSLESVSSAKYITFMERALPFAFLNSRSLGGMVSANGDNWTGAVGLFGDTVTTQNVDDEGSGAAARVTYAPLFQRDRVVHFGLGGQWREPAQSAANPFLETVRFRAKPESNIISDDGTPVGVPAAGEFFGQSSGRLVDTGSIGGDVNDYTIFGAEAATVLGPFSLQGEYMLTNVDRETGEDPVFDGYYVQASYFLTDDVRNYKADKGVFDIIIPSKPFKANTDGWGAWEIATRLSGIDLSDENIDGGDLRDVTVGLNWYLNNFVRLTANYVRVLELDGGAHDNEDIDLFQVRAQVTY